MRVVSLLPSATELLCFVGGRSALVGRSHECDFPASVLDLPSLTGPGVRERRHTLNAELLSSLRPDLILVGKDQFGALPARVLRLDPLSVEDVLDDGLRVGEAVGLGQTAREVVVGLRERMYRAMEHVNPYVDGPSVAFLEGPLMVAGRWTVQLIERAGGRHPLNSTAATEGTGAGMQQAARIAGPGRRVTAEELVASQPEALILGACGLDGARAMARELEREAWWAALPAVRAGRVALVDASRSFGRPGPRLIEGLEWLVGWLNGRPELMPRGFGWEGLGSGLQG